MGYTCVRRDVGLAACTAAKRVALGRGAVTVEVGLERAHHDWSVGVIGVDDPTHETRRQSRL